MSTDPRPEASEAIRAHDIQKLRGIVSTLANFVWTKQLRPGEHLWTIPVDKERDFDCILNDAISELDALRQQLAEASAERERLKKELEGEKGYSGITKMRSEQTERFHTGLMEAFTAAKVSIPEGPVPPGKSLGVWMVEILAAREEALTTALSALEKEWKQSAEAMRLRKGQMTREKRGYEVLANCAADIAALLAAHPEQP